MLYFNPDLGDADFNGLLVNDINSLVAAINKKACEGEFYEIVQETGRFILYKSYDFNSSDLVRMFATNEHIVFYNFLKRYLE